MNFIISGKNIEITPALRTEITDKLGKLAKYFTPDVDIMVTLSVEKERQIIEVTIPVKNGIIRSEQSSTDMYVSIDLVEEVLERQLKKYRTKLIAKNHKESDFSDDFLDPDQSYPDDNEIKIVRTKRFDIKPMFPEDACMQMELLGHSFYIFINAETDEVNVVYKRKGGTYGLIEAEI